MKRRLSAIIESLIVLAFGIDFLARRHRLARFTSTGGESVLIVAPHPDDEAMGCAGSAILHARHGDRVHIAIATDGRLSRAVDDPDEMAKRRRKEAVAAALLMRAECLEWIGLPEGDWTVSTLQTRLKDLLESYAPDVIYAPSRIDFHPEHFKVAHALAMTLNQAQSRLKPRLRIRIYQVQVPLTVAASNLVADVSTIKDEWGAVLRAYGSQAASVNCAYRLRRYGARQNGIAGHAEVFLEMTAKRYISLHRTLPEGWVRVFRGLRHFPLTDPLAFFAGRKERSLLWALGHAARERR